MGGKGKTEGECRRRRDAKETFRKRCGKKGEEKQMR